LAIASSSLEDRLHGGFVPEKHSSIISEMLGKVRLLHLSDIHFRRGLSDTPHDLDRDIRDQLTRDASVLAEQVGEISVVVITGDIAFAGKPDEFDIAGSWLRDFCVAIRIGEQQVWTSPGNHDSDRDIVRSSKPLRTFRKELRRCQIADIDDELREYFSDVTTQTLLLAPLAAYNAFAAPFGCAITAEAPFWEHQLAMNDGSALVIRGLNSVIVSDDTDDIDANKLILGTKQVQCSERPGTTYLTLCHHPPEWLRDRDTVHEYLNARAHVQLFGHKHRQAIEPIAGCLRLTAGAMQPNRREPAWIPRYSLLELSIATDERRTLAVVVHSRRWDDTRKMFVPDFASQGTPYHAYELSLPPWTPTAPPAVGMAFDLAGAIDPAVRLEAPQMDSARRLAYRFLTLPYHERMAIAIELQLVEETDQDLAGQRLFAELFRRARERHKLDVLWEEVERRHADTATENPFRGDGGN
jgi:predicted phosphodiesterase